ncbi:MAG: hypothetical protein CVU48_06410 [Candidatus Cloacimonetes bacterium HGW-Cloacimonetes-1]|jgi:uncharacterized membrane protein YqjE|nr:MAG: hypothetical protein CVU48_06410 [Candidatus Cloacimonetes bacterium HGW-Cloacimonetes-1]
MDINNDSHYYDTDRSAVMSVGDWILTLILVSIPIVNIILIVMWIVDKNSNPNRRNLAVAILILFAIGTVIWVTFMGAIVGALSSVMSF